MTDVFIDACAHGDLAALLAILDPDVSGDGSFGPGVPVPPIAVGADVVARRTLSFLGHGVTVVVHPNAPGPAVLVFDDRRLLVMIEMTIVDGRITDLHAEGDPTALEAVWPAGTRRAHPIDLPPPQGPDG